MSALIGREAGPSAGVVRLGHALSGGDGGRARPETSLIELVTEALRLAAGGPPKLGQKAVNVNLSVRQFDDPTLVPSVAAALNDAALDPGLLCLEVTESFDAERPASRLRAGGLKALGVRVVIDDFGSGNSSLGHLKDLPVDVIKIHRTFTAELGEDTRNTVILHAVITLADTLGITVTAEGVETAEQLRDLRMLRCADGQGYFFSPPVTPDALATYLLGDVREQGIGKLYGRRMATPCRGAVFRVARLRVR